jgi:acyl-CoA reductase-like NAD-dependent aldehyde dehydrogenase
MRLERPTIIAAAWRMDPATHTLKRTTEIRDARFRELDALIAAEDAARRRAKARRAQALQRPPQAQRRPILSRFAPAPRRLAATPLPRRTTAPDLDRTVRADAHHPSRQPTS